MSVGLMPSLAASLGCASSIVGQQFQTSFNLYKLMKNI